MKKADYIIVIRGENDSPVTKIEIAGNGTVRYYKWMVPFNSCKKFPEWCYHRVGGPAIAFGEGGEQWKQGGQFHRIGGPARTTMRNLETSYFIRGVQMSEIEHNFWYPNK